MIFEGIYNELELLALLKDGDESAFSEIYKKHWQTVYTAAYRRLRDKEQCQDIVQNIFISLWNRRSTLTIENLNNYLATAVKFQVINYATRKPHQTTFFDEFEYQLAAQESSDDRVLENEVKSLVLAFIETLPEKRKQIFLLYYHEHLSTAEIATRLNISQKTVQNQLNTANHALRDHILLFMTISTAVLLNTNA